MSFVAVLIMPRATFAAKKTTRLPFSFSVCTAIFSFWLFHFSSVHNEILSSQILQQKIQEADTFLFRQYLQRICLKLRPTNDVFPKITH